MVAAVTRRRYPDLGVPYHSRWRHFETGGIDRKAELDRALAGPQRRRPRACPYRPYRGERAAGRRRRPGMEFCRSRIGTALHALEGLAVASFRAFMRGAFSARQDDPLRVDAPALAAMDAATLASLFQAGTANPLLGLDGRAALLRRLGSALTTQRDAFGDSARPGALFDTLTAHGTRRAVSASTLLEALLDGLGTDMAERKCARWRASGRRVAPSARGRQRPHRGLGAVSQAFAVARLFAVRTFRMGRGHGDGPRSTDGAARIPATADCCWTPACCSLSTRRMAHGPGTWATSSSSSGGR